MKKRTINAVLTKKFKEWTSSIEDGALRKRVDEGSIITGGSIASMLMKEPVNDFDVYFKSKELAADVAEYYVSKFNEANGTNYYVLKEKPTESEAYAAGGVGMNMDNDRVKIIVKSGGVDSEADYEPDYVDMEDAEDAMLKGADLTEKDPVEKPRYRPVYLSANAITLSNKIQIIIRFHGTPEQIHENFDYVHCINYWESNGKLTLQQEALESILAKELVYVGSKYPIASIIRSRKYIKRGWTINAGQFLKMAYQVSELDLDDVSVLEDQLTGVDLAYFHQLIEGLKSVSKKDDFKLNYSYLAKIIDKIF